MVKNSKTCLGVANFFLKISKKVPSAPVPEYVGKFSSIPVPVVTVRVQTGMYLYPTCTCCTLTSVVPASFKKYLFQALASSPWRVRGGMIGRQY